MGGAYALSFSLLSSSFPLALGELRSTETRMYAIAESNRRIEVDESMTNLSNTLLKGTRGETPETARKRAETHGVH